MKAPTRNKGGQAKTVTGQTVNLALGDDSPANVSEVSSKSDNHEAQIQRAYLEQLFAALPEAIAILNMEGEVGHVNPEFTRLFGYSETEARGKNLSDLIVPPDRKAEAEWLQSAIRQGQKVGLESKRFRKDGSQVDVSVLGTPVSIGGGQVAICAIFRDITESKRAQILQAALYRIAEITSTAENLEGVYRVIHRIVGDLMCAENFYIALYDASNRVLTFPYFVDQIDSPPGNVPLSKGLTEYVLHTGEPLLATPEVFDRLVEQGKVESVGPASLDWLGVPLKSGSQTFGVLVVQSYSERVRFGESEKEILNFVSQHVATAIEHKRHQQSLRESEQQYRSLVQSAVYGIYRSTLDGKFLDVNPALTAMLGYETAEEVLKLDPEKDLFVNSEDRLRLKREYEGAGRVNSLEVSWKRKDGLPITVRLSGSASIRGKGGKDVVEVIAEDVTERRGLEEQFRQAQKMEAVGRLAGGVAHDFNNLLMVISGYIEVLLTQMVSGDPRRKKAEAIQNATQRASVLTRQLLAFGRKQVLELKVIDLNAVVVDMARLIEPLIGEDVELILLPAGDLGRTKADAGQIEQVIMNLAVNARDAMPNGGKLIIQTSNVELDGAYRRGHVSIQPGPYVMLAVSDTGCGMDGETLSRIFEPFFTTKEKGKGTGLGLSTVYGIIKQSGGYIFAYSEVGRGTTFKIYLPQLLDAQGEEASSPAHPSNAGHHQGTETLLVVEDEESVRELLRESLEAKGYKVVAASRGDEALSLANNHQIDLMLTDVVMPGMSGKELAKKILELHPEVKVLFLSGYTEDAIVHQGVLDAGTAFLQKPFTLDALGCKVREVLESQN
jgi:two-component system cell cycle sensor histidine kinase/response regulator CckA